MITFSFTGWSNSGKTTLITRLIKEFKRKNKTVMVVKNAPHKYHLEPESKDTFRFLEAGSAEVYLVSKKEVLNMRKIEEDKEIFDVIESKLNDFDILLLEGLYRDDIPVIEVFDSKKNDQLRFSLGNLSAVVADRGITKEIPCFNINDIKGILKFMEDYCG